MSQRHDDGFSNESSLATGELRAFDRPLFQSIISSYDICCMHTYGWMDLILVWYGGCAAKIRHSHEIRLDRPRSTSYDRGYASRERQIEMDTICLGRRNRGAAVLHIPPPNISPHGIVKLTSWVRTVKVTLNVTFTVRRTRYLVSGSIPFYAITMRGKAKHSHLWSLGRVLLSSARFSSTI